MQLLQAYRSAPGKQKAWLWVLTVVFAAYLPVTFMDAAVGHGPWRPVRYLNWSLSIGAVVFTAALAIATGKERARASAPTRSLWQLTAKYAALPFLVFCGYLVVFFPAMMNVDSYDQWTQIREYRFDAFFPVANTLLYWLPSLIWRSPAAPMLVQMVLLAAVFGFAMALAEQQGAPRWLPWASTLLFALHPVNGFFSITFLKDPLFSAAILWLTVVVFWIYQTGGGALESRSARVHLTLALASVALLRPNGVVPAFGTITLLLVSYRGRLRRLLVSLVAFVALYYGVNVGLARATHVSYAHNGFYTSTPFIFDIGAVLHSDLVRPAASPGNEDEKKHGKKSRRKKRGKRKAQPKKEPPVVAANGKITPEERATLQQFDDVDEWARMYRPALIPYWHTEKDHWNLLDRPSKKRELVRTWFALARRYPGIILKHKIGASRIGWRIDSYVQMETYGPEPKRLGMSTARPAPALEDAANSLLDAIQKERFRWFGAHPGIWTYGSLFLLAAFALRRLSARALLVAVPLVLNWLPMMAFCLAQNTRYFYASFLVLPFAVLLPFTRATPP